MKLTINGIEQEKAELKGETLEAILDMMVKNTPDSYIRRIWLDKKEYPADDQEILQKRPADISTLEVELAYLKDLVATNLTNALGYLEKLIPGFDQAADLNGLVLRSYKYCYEFPRRGVRASRYLTDPASQID